MNKHNLLIICLLPLIYKVSAEMSDLISVEYEVFGVVQGVFFRKYTEGQANTLKLKGWVRNTPSGTVEGVLEGPVSIIGEMKSWLQTKGSPQSRIDKAVFKNEHPINEYSYQNFSIKRS